MCPWTFSPQQKKAIIALGSCLVCRYLIGSHYKWYGKTIDRLIFVPFACRCHVCKTSLGMRTFLWRVDQRSSATKTTWCWTRAVRRLLWHSSFASLFFIHLKVVCFCVLFSRVRLIYHSVHSHRSRLVNLVDMLYIVFPKNLTYTQKAAVTSWGKILTLISSGSYGYTQVCRKRRLAVMAATWFHNSPVVVFFCFLFF